MQLEAIILKQFTEYGLLGVFFLILLWVVYKLTIKIDTRNAEDRQILGTLGKNQEQSNQLYQQLIEEIRLTREFFKITVDHERDTSRLCFSEVSINQKEMKELLIKLTASQNSLHKRLDGVVL